MNSNFSSAPGFNLGVTMPVGAAPVYNQSQYSNPPPIPMQYAFYPGNPILAQVGLRLPQFGWPPVQLVQQHQPVPVAGLMHTSAPAGKTSVPSSALTMTDKTLTAFQERAKKCGITIELSGRSSVANQNDLTESDFNPFKFQPTNSGEHFSQFFSNVALKEFELTCGSMTQKKSDFNTLKFQPTSSVEQSSQCTSSTAHKEIDMTLYNSMSPSSGEHINGLMQPTLATLHSEEAGFVDRSWSIHDGSEEAEEHLMLFSPLPPPPPAEEPYNVLKSDNEFTEAAERWRMTERMKDASCQTPVVMTISACVGTASKVLVDSSTNTAIAKTKLYVDAATNTEDGHLNVKLRNDLEKPAASKPLLRDMSTTTCSLEDVFQSSVLLTSSPAKKEKYLNEIKKLSIEQAKASVINLTSDEYCHEPSSTALPARGTLSVPSSRIQKVQCPSEDESQVGLQPMTIKPCSLPPGLDHVNEYVSKHENVNMPHQADNEDVYYSDEESPVPPSSDSSSTASYLTLEQQQLVNQMVMQMIFVNPSFASCNPVVLQDVAVRYLISAKILNETPSPVNQSPLSQEQDFTAAEMFYDLKSQVCDEQYGDENKRHVRGEPEDVPLRQIFSGATDSSRLAVEDFYGKSVEKDSEHHSLTKNTHALPRGRGRSATSCLASIDTNEVRPRGRGRGRGERSETVQNQSEGICCFKLLDDKMRPGVSHLSSKVSLHPPVSAATLKHPPLPRDIQSTSFGWDCDAEEFSPKLSCFKTSK